MVGLASGTQIGRAAESPARAGGGVHGSVVVKLENHGMTGRLSPALAKKSVIGQLARPYDDAVALKPELAGTGAVSTMDEPSGPITAVALSVIAAPLAPTPRIAG